MKALIHFAPRAGAETAFEERFQSLVVELRERNTSRRIEVNAMRRLTKDPLGPDTPYRATLEFLGGSFDPDEVATWVTGLGERFDDVAHADLGTALVGEDRVFLASERAPVRYQYLMRRNADWTHRSYIERYRTIHAEIGVKTPGILGYAQLHVDLPASRALAASVGHGVCRVDSVAQLYLESMRSFFGAIVEANFGAEAVADEELFVDRARSWDFCSAVDWQA